MNCLHVSFALQLLHVRQLVEVRASLLAFRKALIVRLPCSNNLVANCMIDTELWFEADTGKTVQVASSSFRARDLLRIAKCPIRKSRAQSSSRDADARNATASSASGTGAFSQLVFIVIDDHKLRYRYFQQ